MKIIISSLAAASLLAACSTALAAPATTTVCTSSSKSAETPSGSYTDSNGRKWTGFKADGTPPDSLSSDSTDVSCTTVVTNPV